MNQQTEMALDSTAVTPLSSTRGMNVVVIDSMPIEEYHDDFDSISSSGLKTLIFQSPGHYKAELDARRKAREEERKADAERLKAEAEKVAAGVVGTPGDGDGTVGVETAPESELQMVDTGGTEATNFGTATHALLLEPDDFRQNFVVMPKFDRRTKKGKADSAAFLRDHPGMRYVTKPEYDMMEKIIANIGKHALAKRLLEGGVKEQSIFWTDPRTGVRLRIRPDNRSPHAIVDLKSTKDASREGFKWEARRYGYDLSAAMYQEGCFHAFGEELPFAFLCAEKVGPCAVALYPACGAMMEEGYSWYRKAVDKYAWCLEHDEWPLYQDGTEYEEMLWVPRR